MEDRPRARFVVGEGDRDAGLFAEAEEKGEVRLAILDLVMELGEGRAIERPHRRDPPRREHPLEDLGHREVLEDPVIAPQPEQPELRRDPEGVGRQSVGLRAQLLDVAADARPRAARATRAPELARHDAQRGRATHDRAELEIGLGRHGHHGDLEELRDRLTHLEGAHRERHAFGGDLEAQVAPRVEQELARLRAGRAHRPGSSVAPGATKRKSSPRGPSAYSSLSSPKSSESWSGVAASMKTRSTAGS